MKCLDGSNDVKVYNLTAAKVQPEWVKKKKKKPRSNDDDLLQDFVMPDVSNCLKLSPDGQYLVVCGTYKPVMKCYDLSELSVKFERGMDYETNRVEILSDDYSKIAYLQENRYIELHGQGGKVHRLRIPKFGRDLGLHKPSADLYIAASGDEVYRLNLFQGRFLNSLAVGSVGVNRLIINDHHGLVTLGTDDGVIQCWDPRDRSCAGTLDCGKHMVEYANSLEEEIRTHKDLRVTSLQYSGPHTLAVGNYTGQIYMYDIRCRSPYLIRDHHTRSPIHALHFHSSGNVFSMAPNVLKIWDKNTGAAVTSVEGDAPFNDMAVVPGTGLAFFAAEDKAMKAYFIPSLGPAPAWCAHLDAMTEELEEDEAATVAAQYDDYTFVTEGELLELGLKDLVGTNMLRAALHGYYINNSLYQKAKRLAMPVKPQNVIKQKLKETIAEENKIKINENEKEGVVNQEVLAAVAEEFSEEVLDERISKLFRDKRFARDPELAKRLDRSGNAGVKMKEAFKKRKREIEREEQEFVDNGDGEVSDADSVLGAIEEKAPSSDSEEDEQREEQRRQLFRSKPRRF